MEPVSAMSTEHLPVEKNYADYVLRRKDTYQTKQNTMEGSLQCDVCDIDNDS